MIKKRKFVFLIVLLSLLVLIVTGGFVSRRIILNRLKSQVQAGFNFSRMSLSLIPPALVLEDVKTRRPGPFFSAKRVSVTTGFLSLLSKTKPVSVILDQPVIRMSENDLKRLGGGESSSSLPFIIDKAWVRLADITLETSAASYHCWKANGVFAKRGRGFSLEASIADNVVTLKESGRHYQGSLHVLLDGRGDSLRVKNLAVEGPSLALKAKGTINGLSDPDLDFYVVFNGETSLPMDIFGIPFRWTGKTRGEGTVRRAKKQLAIETSLYSRDLTMTGIPLGEVTGRFHLKGSSGEVDVTISRPPEPRAYVKILYGNDRFRGILSGVPLDPVMKEINLAWPIASPAWGEFTVGDGHLHVEAELRSLQRASFEADRFPFDGRAVVNWDGKTRVDFSAKKVRSSFGQFDVDGRLNLGTDLDIALSGESGDVRRTRRFAELFLRTRFPLPEVEGRGSVELKVFGDYLRPSVDSQFFLYPAGVGPWTAAFIEGNVEIRPGQLKGLFRLDDPQLMGVVNVLERQDALDVEVKASRARLEYLLAGLKVKLPLTGEASGQFKVRSQGGETRVEGDFAVPSLSFLGMPFRDMRGRVRLSGQSLEFPELRLTWNGGPIQAQGRLDFATKEYSLDLDGKAIDLAPISPGLGGLASFNLKGQGVLGRDASLGRVDVQRPAYGDIQAASLGGDLKLNVLEDRLEAGLQGAIGTPGNDFTVGLAVPFGRGFYALNVKGSLNDLDILMPWDGVKGRLNYLAEIAGTESDPRISGALDIQGSVLPIPGFSQAFADYSALAFFEKGTLTLRSFQAKLGGGDVRGSGEVRLSGPNPGMLLGLEGKDMILIPLERTRALADASLRLIRDPGRFVLEGNVQVKRMSWRREIDEPFVFSSTSFYRRRPNLSLFDDLRLNIRLKADNDAWVENSLGRIRGRFDLTLTGGVDAPIVLGEIEALSGTVNFQDRSFNILSGKLSFFNPLAVEPYLDFKGEAYVKDYRVTFSLNGLIDHLRPEYSSSPPLPPEDVLALLALGESFKRTYITDVSSRLSSASLLASQLSEEAQKRASKIFSLDRISIDPFVMGSSTELVPRLTLGKKIRRNLSIYYSTNLTTQREEIVRMELELGRNFSLVGNRDELGTVSFDVKLRKRF